jgi:hypothetical protein
VPRKKVHFTSAGIIKLLFSDISLPEVGLGGGGRVRGGGKVRVQSIGSIFISFFSPIVDSRIFFSSLRGGKEIQTDDALVPHCDESERAVPGISPYVSDQTFPGPEYDLLLWAE